MLLDLYSLIYTEAGAETINGTATPSAFSSVNGTIDAGAITIAGTATAITSSPVTGTVNLSYTIVATQRSVRRMTTKKNFFLVDWRSNWTDAQKARPCARASISTVWASYPFSYPGVECFPGIQPTTILNIATHVVHSAYPPGSYQYDLYWDLYNANPEYLKLNGEWFTIWTNYINEPPYTPPTYGVFAIDIRIPEVRAIWVDNIVSHFSSFCKGIHHDYFTSLGFLEGDQSIYGFINPEFSNSGAPEYDPTIWSDWDAGYIAQIAAERVAWPGVIIMGQQFHATTLTPYVDGLFLEENLWHWEPYVERPDEVIEWLNGTGQGQDTLVDNMWPSTYPGNNSTLQSETYRVAKDIGGYIGWGRDTASGSGFPWYDYGTLIAGGVTFAGTSTASSFSAVSGSIIAGAVTISGDSANGIESSAVNGSLISGALEISGTSTSISLSAVDGLIVTAGTIQGTATTGSFAAVNGSVVSGLATISGTSTAIASSTVNGQIVAGEVFAGTATSVVISSVNGTITAGSVTVSGTSTTTASSSVNGSISIGAVTISGTSTAIASSPVSGAVTAGNVEVAGTATAVAYSTVSGAVNAGAVSLAGTSSAASFVSVNGIVVTAGFIPGTATTVSLSTVEGSFTVGPMSIAGTATTASLSAVSGSVDLGITIQGTPSQISMGSVDGSLTAGAASISGSASAMTLGSVAGSIPGSGSTVFGTPTTWNWVAIDGVIETGYSIIGTPTTWNWAAIDGSLSAGPVTVSGTSRLISMYAPNGYISIDEPLIIELVGDAYLQLSVTGDVFVPLSGSGDAIVFMNLEG